MLMLHLRRMLSIALLSLCLCAIATAQDPPPKPSISEKIAADATKLDLNTATPEQLKALPGMGDACVQRIVDGPLHREESAGHAWHPAPGGV